MHLLRGNLSQDQTDGEAVDLGQSPGDTVIISAADTELAALAAAFDGSGGEAALGSLRLANMMQLMHPYSVDLYADDIWAKAKSIVLRVLGGKGYWGYGVEQAAAVAKRTGARLFVLPGDAKPDEELSRESTVSADEVKTLADYFNQGGPDNLRQALAYLAGQDCLPPQPLIEAGIYAGAPTAAPTVAIVFYRAHYQTGNLAPIDALVEACADQGLNAIAIFAASLKEPVSAGIVAKLLKDHDCKAVLNTTAFAIGTPDKSNAGPFAALDIPVFQVVMSSSTQEAWAGNPQGMGPRDVAMHVSMPEIDGRILTRAVSFKSGGQFHAPTQCYLTRYEAAPDRAAWVAELAANWVRLQATQNADKKLAIVLANYPNKDGRLANGVGLDTPASAAELIKALAQAGYETGPSPTDGQTLIETLAAGATNALNRDRKGVTLPVAAYHAWFDTLPENAQQELTARWGEPIADPFVQGLDFVLPFQLWGHLAVGIQPARGYNIDPEKSYHDPDLIPPHGYLASYLWLRQHFGAQAIVHLGKHGNLEWLPGKALALSADCWPEIALGPIPQLYPFIVNDPGEGAQAKRRTAAVIIDHLTPPLTRAETYGDLAQLERMVDEYAEASGSDARRAKILQRDILELTRALGLDKDMGISDDTPQEQALETLDNHLCELKELQIRDGLHILGVAPSGEQRRDLLSALLRLPRFDGEGANASLTRALAEDLGFEPADFDPLDCDLGVAWTLARPEALAGMTDQPWRTNGDTVERLELLALELIDGLASSAQTPSSGPDPEPSRSGRQEKGPGSSPGRDGDSAALRSGLDPEPSIAAAMDPGSSPGKAEQHTPSSGLDPEPSSASPQAETPGLGGGAHAIGPRTQAVLTQLATQIAPAVDGSAANEITQTLRGLEGRFIPPGPSGAPSRGRPDVLPTGRNFFSIDSRSLPTQTAWRLGQASAAKVVERFVQDHGDWPRSLALSAWGTANMRTGGDDIAQALALMGVKPKWDQTSGRVTGFEIIDLRHLGRPRVDVTLRVSGFFRDAFPAQIALFDQAVRAVAELDEPAERNPLAATVKAEVAGGAEARMASYRVFGSKPGAYGAGLQALIDEGGWEQAEDLASAYLAWSGYAYGDKIEGAATQDQLEARLKGVQAVLHNQDNREHDILDSDDYYQFEGGLAVSVKALTGAAPAVYHNDHSRPETPRVRSLQEEIGRVVRGRAVNPKWIKGVMRHGYKGAFEVAATVDYLFAFAATTEAVSNQHFDAIYGAYVADPEVWDWMGQVNPAARDEMMARLQEALDRGLWVTRRNDVGALNA